MTYVVREEGKDKREPTLRKSCCYGTLMVDRSYQGKRDHCKLWPNCQRDSEPTEGLASLRCPGLINFLNQKPSHTLFQRNILPVKKKTYLCLRPKTPPCEGKLEKTGFLPSLFLTLGGDQSPTKWTPGAHGSATLLIPSSALTPHHGTDHYPGARSSTEP